MSCTYYRWEGGSFFGDYWCDKKDCRVDSDTYRKYCRDYNYDECPIYRQSESSTPCFITTMCCNILGLPDNHEVLNTLRTFRNNILQKDKEYEEILKIYDAIGPLVADSILKDENKKQVAIELYNTSLLPIVALIKNNDYTRAVTHYLYMTLYLISEYNLRIIYNNLRTVDFGFINFEQTKAGHGYRKVLLPKETTELK